MLKNNILLSIFAAFAIITLFIVRWVNNTQRELDLCEIFHKNVESGILSAMNLSSSLNGKVFEVGNAAFYNAEFSEIKGPASFENAIILYINSEMCNPCVQYALNTFSEIQINSEKINFFIYGGTSNLRDLHVLLVNSGLSYYGTFTSEETLFSSLLIEKLPIILKIGQNGIIENSCYLDNRMSISFYRSFLAK
jgi:hypothetical protein